MKKNNQGFTLFELLLSMAILAILLSVGLLAINPAAQFAKARNTKRLNDITLILNAIGQYSSEHHGLLPPAVPTGTAQSISDKSGGANLCSDLMPTFIPAIPSDPKTGGGDIVNCTNYDSGYTIVKDAYNRVTVTAPNVELPATSITITR